MTKLVLFVLVSKYADWECAFLSAALNGGLADSDPTGEAKPRYRVKTVGLTMEPALSFGGFQTIIDYDLNSYPDDYAAVVLIGGSSWRSERMNLLLPLVKEALDRGQVVGAICDASLFLGVNGFLNGVKHTSNTLDTLVDYPDTKYTNAGSYLEQQAVSDGSIITANGTAYLEFARELLRVLDAYTPEQIEAFYRTYKFGFHPL